MSLILVIIGGVAALAVVIVGSHWLLRRIDRKHLWRLLALARDQAKTQHDIELVIAEVRKLECSEPGDAVMRGDCDFVVRQLLALQKKLPQ